MSSDRVLLHTLVDSLPEAEIPVALSFLSELRDEETIDADTAAKLDQARQEPGEDVPMGELRRRLGL